MLVSFPLNIKTESKVFMLVNILEIDEKLEELLQQRIEENSLNGKSNNTDGGGKFYKKKAFFISCVHFMFTILRME